LGLYDWKDDTGNIEFDKEDDLLKHLLSLSLKNYFFTYDGGDYLIGELPSSSISDWKSRFESIINEKERQKIIKLLNADMETTGTEENKIKTKIIINKIKGA